MPIKLRRRVLADGRESLFLDIYLDGRHQYEFLKLYLVPETTSTAKRENARTLRKADSILAQRIESLYNNKVDALTPSQSADMLLSDWLQTSYDNHAKRGSRDLRNISNARESVMAFRPEAKLLDVDKQFCLDYQNWLRNDYRTKWGSTLKQKSQHSYWTTLRTALNEAVKDGLIQVNPWNLIEPIDKITNPVSKREFMTIDEIKRLIAAPIANEQVKMAYLFSCFCGLRISDIRKLRWRDISTIGNDWTVSVVMQKTQAPVVIPLSAEARKWLPTVGNADELVFAGLPNNSNVGLNLKNWAKAAGITKNVTFHTARHSCATMLLTLGADLYTVSKILGHRSVRHTQVYAKIIDSKKDEAIRLIDNAF